jgi:hypothetical protein
MGARLMEKYCIYFEDTAPVMQMKYIIRRNIFMLFRYGGR